ncbi:MAG: GNAT family N-acetyltransferase [Clostridia bacterium]|nr:GNAT family N-acetyltransferase [Clostridia bacterium]
MIIRKADRKDAWGVLALALLLWPDRETNPLFEEISNLLDDPESGVFVAADGKVLAGFAQCAMRHDSVQGSLTGPVGYLEGIFVREAYRRQGVARALTDACERWAKAQNCTEFASDCPLENPLAIRFHHGAGFHESNRIVYFIKRLQEESNA